VESNGHHDAMLI